MANIILTVGRMFASFGKATEMLPQLLGRLLTHRPLVNVSCTIDAESVCVCCAHSITSI